MSTVFLATDPALGREVAIKVMRLDLYSGDVRLQERFHREARSTAALRHPNIVTVFDINEADGQLFIAMEYLEGRTLLELLREGPLAIADTLRWVDELCDALSYAHQRGVIHRDVKPSNLMIQPDGHLKVMDFGIAREVDSGLTRAGDILGTLNYMAPERLTGRPIDHRSDIFDVGAVFYEAVTGKKAFPGDQPAVIAQDILHKQPEPIVHVVPAIDPRIVAIIERCLQKAPEGRYDSLIDMRRDLEPLLRGRDRHDPLLATPIGRFDAQPVGPAPVSVPLPPPSVTRPADVVIRLTGAPAREPLDADGARHFVGRSAELNTMARQVASARGGSFLITGYRGIGKTSFVNQLVALVTQDLERAHGPTLVVVRVEVPTRLEPAQLMHRILTRLAAELEARNIEERLPAKLRNTIAGAMRRTKFDVKETSGRESETGVDAELSGPGAKLSGGRKHKVTSGSELRSLTYDDQAAEADLIRISRALSTGHTPEASWWQRILQSFGKAAAATVKFRVVFVIDELDKLDQETPADRPAALDAVFSSLKTLLTTSGMTFVFVGGRDMQDRWYQDVTRGDSIYQSVSSHHAYLPCLWTEVSSVCDSLLQPSRDNGAPVLDHFRGFIRYKGRGIPRLALDSMRQFVDWQPEPPCLKFTPEDVRMLSFHHGLSAVLQGEFARVTPGQGDVQSVERDQQCLGVHYLADWILRRGHAEFTRAEARDVLLNLRASIAPKRELADSLTDRSLSLLEREDYITSVGRRPGDLHLDDLVSRDQARYRLGRRRIAEMGGAAAPAPEFPPEAPADDLPVTVRNYQLQDRIGEGGMGVVFRARDTTRPRTAAIKLLRPAMRDNHIARARFAREAAVLRRLSHPGIVKFYDAGLDPAEPWPFIAMELVDGTPLSRLLKASGAFSEDIAVGLVADAASAFEHVHASGFVRNDIKPDNIFVLGDGHTKLIDFGISKQVGGDDDLTLAGAFVGTPHYAAPEMWTAGVVDQRADVYALGAVLYELVTGKVPFDRQEREAIMSAHLIDAPVAPSKQAKVSAALDQVILTALAKDPAARYEGMAAFREALESVGHAPRSAMQRAMSESERAADLGSGETVFARIDDLRAATPKAADSARTPAAVAETKGPMLLLGDPKETRFSLIVRRGRNVIGRDPGANIVLNRVSVSRFHSVVTWDDGGIWVEDLNSANGTLVNGERVSARRRLAPGDRLSVGDADLELSV